MIFFFFPPIKLISRQFFLLRAHLWVPLLLVNQKMAFEPEKFPALCTLERFGAGVHGTVFFEIFLIGEPPLAHFTLVRVGVIVLYPSVTT